VDIEAVACVHNLQYRFSTGSVQVVGVADPLEALSCPTCYCSKFCRSRSNRSGIGGDKKLGTRAAAHALAYSFRHILAVPIVPPVLLTCYLP